MHKMAFTSTLIIILEVSISTEVYIIMYVVE